jgi:hypothetical protein
MSMGPYQAVRSVLSVVEARTLAVALLIQERKGGLENDSQQVVGSSVVHGDAHLDALLLRLHPTMEKVTQLALIPTYSFARIYRDGDELVAHTDRPACEISATLTLGFVADRIWDIYADGEPVSLDVGDMLVYRGCDVRHWRQPFVGTVWVQVFLHYVNANGPYASAHAFDQRQIGPFYETLYKEILYRDR